ncbi:MAG: phosphotransferase [Bacillota bacterium]
MDIQSIIHHLIKHNIVDSEPEMYEQLTGGTVSELYLLKMKKSKCVVKINKKPIIQSEANFLEVYKRTNFVPQLLFIEPSFHYILYSFIEGSTIYEKKNKKDMLKSLVDGLINHYQQVPERLGWGWADQPVKSWKEFLIDEITYANTVLHTELESKYYERVLSIIEKTSYVEKPYLLHGDCGVHNFMFRKGELCGVIDPTPVLGEPMHDLIYAFCSSPEELTKETLDFAVDHLSDKSQTYVYGKVLIGLYLRLATSWKHHREDFDDYVKAWDYWEEIVSKSKEKVN